MSWLTWPLRLIAFGVWFALQIVIANARLLRDLLSPRDRATPLIIKVPTRCRGDVEVALLSILVSLTPGTLVVATERPRERPDAHEQLAADAPGILYIHAMYLTRSAVLAEIEETETRMLAAIRRQRVAS